MREILWLIITSLILGYVITIRDEKLSYIGKEKKDRFFTIVLILILGLFCGLRTWYNDTVTYIQIYEQVPLITDFWGSPDAEIAMGLGFGLFNSIMKTIGLSTQDYLMIYAFLSIIPLVLFIRKYSTSLVFSLFLMFMTGYYIFALAAVKQVVATGICLLAVTEALEKRWLRYFILIILAILFHPYSVVYLLVPFMMFKPWTYKTLFCMILFVLIGFGLEQLLGIVLDITVLIGAEYNQNTFIEEGVSAFRVMVAAVPIILALLYGKNLFYQTTRSENLMFNLAMLNALIMFVGLFGTANYFARLANYFLPAQIIVIPWVLQRATSRDKKWLVPVCVICYMLYFYYEHGILRNFDESYSSISLIEYLLTVF